jgi:hypothetical protein
MMKLGETDGGENFVPRRLGIGEGDVVVNGVVKQDTFLGNGTEVVAQGQLGDIGDVGAVDRNGTGLEVIEAEEQADEGRFARAGGTEPARLFGGAEFSGRNPTRWFSFYI